MKATSRLDVDKKIATILAILVLITSSVTIAFAITPPTIPGNEMYMNDEGVLDSDSFVLYPYEEKSINIGFSKYGELIDGHSGVGLEYDGVDVFANPAVAEWKWSNGWVIEIHYTEQNKLRSVWAYALYSDNSGVGGIGDDWKQMQQSKDASAAGDEHGGRRTSGYAETDDIRLIYDGPRKAIYLLKTTIYDKDPSGTGKCLVEITVQLVFNKVKKYVMEIKDIKRCDDNKFDGPFQIEFSQRGEWDIGTESNNEAWAEFYDGFETKYWKHPFYFPCENRDPVEFDVCQMIDQDETLVGFAAFWPNLISKWVTNVDSIDHLGGDDIPGKLETMETEEKYIEVPTALPPNVLWPNYLSIDGEDNLLIDLQDELVEYPRGACEWSDEPWVFIKNEQGEYVKKVPGIHWTWSSPYVIIDEQYWEPGEEIVVVYKRVMKGHEAHEIAPLECNELPADTPSYGMLDEPKVPYVFAEWDFDLDYDNPENSTQQFRCVSVYGLTDYNDAIDPDMPGHEGDPMATPPVPADYRIDCEVQYQLNEIFNPWDLKDAANKETFRWAQKGTIEGDDIILASHLHDKYGNERDCLEQEHDLVQACKWGYYCNDDEKVILYDSTGTLDPLLLTRPFNYTIQDFVVTINDLTEYADYDLYKVLYSTELSIPDVRPFRPYDWSVGRWEWIVVGEPSLASDSIGTGMVGAAWLDWKNVETWLSGLDVEAEVYGPAIPYVLRPMDGDYKDDLGRLHFKDDWSTPDDWAGEEIYPYAISSSNVIVVGGPLVNLAAEYYNDFTDAFVFSEYGDGFYAPGCWSRTTQGPYWEGMDPVMVPDDELWYDSTVVAPDDEVGYAIISTYKDLNETKGFIVYGYTAEDTYYACYALRGGLLEWLQHVQDGVTTIVLRIDYEELHPVGFHVEEMLGPFTECTGFDTNFKTDEYYDNYNDIKQAVEDRAAELGICYKLVDIDYCSQVHPDP